jgi:putative transposase
MIYNRGMPRKARAAVGGLPFHVYNHGNGRLRIFNQPEDYDLFLSILAQGREKAAVRILGYSLMPTHWRLVVFPVGDGDLSKFMSWVGNTHVRRWHAAHRSAGGGHIYQSRYRSFPIQQGAPLLEVIQYVESEAARADLSPRAERWMGSSAYLRTKPAAAKILSNEHLVFPPNWRSMLNRDMDDETTKVIELCLMRGRPYGSADWVNETVKRLGLESSMRDPWRPRHTTSPSPRP